MKIVKIVFCECGTRTGRKVDIYDDSYENLLSLYKNCYFGKCTKCNKNLSPKKFWSEAVNGKPIKERFESMYVINEQNGCWEWIRTINPGDIELSE